MYTLSDLRTALDNPEWFAREPNRLYAHRLNLRDHNPDGINVFEQDWDNLILLDACRYDELERIEGLPGELTKVISRGTTSSEFVRGNFTGRKLHDVVYVSANPYYAYLRDEIDTEVHAFIGLFEDEFLDDEGLTTLPETVTQYAIQAHREFPNKRLLIHYLQPHQPYIGSFGKERFEHGRGLIDTVKMSQPSRTELLRAYRENLEIVLEEVDILLEHFVGKTVVSADHGEMLGERMTPLPVRDYGHHAGVYIKELLEVPWLVITGDERKNIVSEPPVDIGEYEIDAVCDRLRDLGYLS